MTAGGIVAVVRAAASGRCLAAGGGEGPWAAVIGLTVLFGRSEGVASSAMADQSLSEQAYEAVLKSIIKSAPTVGNSPAGIRDLAAGHALLERELVPNAGVVQNKT